VGRAVIIRMLENVQQATIWALINQFIAPGTRVYTDEYDIYHRLPTWGATTRSATAGANTPVMTMGMASRKCM